jgi:hypothetical protein
VARVPGLTTPPTPLAHADEVIEQFGRFPHWVNRVVPLRCGISSLSGHGRYRLRRTDQARNRSCAPGLTLNRRPSPGNK